jgi:hypothetical protein
MMRRDHAVTGFPEQWTKLWSWYVISVSLILLTAGVAKSIGIQQSAAFLSKPNSIITLFSNRHLFWGISSLEIGLGALLWRAGLFRGAGIKMVRGDWRRGGGMVRRMGGVLIRGSSRSSAEKLPRIDSVDSTGDGFSPDCGAVRRSRRGRAGGGARVRRHPAPRMPVVVVSGPVAEPVGGRAGG